MSHRVDSCHTPPKQFFCAQPHGFVPCTLMQTRNRENPLFCRLERAKVSPNWHAKQPFFRETDPCASPIFTRRALAHSHAATVLVAGGVVVFSPLRRFVATSLRRFARRCEPWRTATANPAPFDTSEGVL